MPTMLAPLVLIAATAMADATRHIQPDSLRVGGGLPLTLGPSTTDFGNQYGVVDGRAYEAVLHTTDLRLPLQFPSGLRWEPEGGLFFANDGEERIHSLKGVSHLSKHWTVGRKGSAHAGGSLGGIHTADWYDSDGWMDWLFGGFIGGEVWVVDNLSLSLEGGLLAVSTPGSDQRMLALNTQGKFIARVWFN